MSSVPSPFGGDDKSRPRLKLKFRLSSTPLIRTLVIRIASYPDRLGTSGKSVEHSAKLTCLEIISYRIKYSTVLRVLEPQIRRGENLNEVIPLCVYIYIHFINIYFRKHDYIIKT